MSDDTKTRCPTCDADATSDMITIHSGVNAEYQGFVHLAWGHPGMRTQLTPAQLRAHALLLLEAAEAAETDAAVLRLLTEKVGIDQPRALNVIAELRNYRDDRYTVKK